MRTSADCHHRPNAVAADVIAFNEREKAREMPYFGQEILEMAQKKGPLTSPAYVGRSRRVAPDRARSASTP